MTILCSGYDPARPCPVECQSQLLLDEFRTWRDKFDEKLDQVTQEISDWKQDQGERLTEVEVKAKDISGNGQPGRMKDAEDEIAELQRGKYWVMGWAAGIAGVAAMVFEVVRGLMEKR